MIRQRPVRHQKITGLAAVMALIVLGLTVADLGRAVAAPGTTGGSFVLRAAPGDNRVEPAAINTEVQAGPWKLTVLEVQTGDQAAQLVTRASQFNEGPADGSTYVAVRIRAVNGSSQTQSISGNDFAVSGSSGLVRRFVGAIPPDPALEGDVAAGETKEGWIVGGAAADEQNLILLFDSVTLTGNWADRVFALQDGATIPDATDRASKLNKTGRSPGDPAGLNDPVATRDWVIEIEQVAVGQEVYDLFPPSDYRTTALADSQGGEDIPYWVAFLIKVTNNRTGGAPSFFPPTAITLADPDGNPVFDALTLSAPNPDASGLYYPGASREGWVAIEQPKDYPGALLRFLPYQIDPDPRYLTWDAGAAAAANQPTPTSGPIDTGTIVVTTDNGVNVRAQPSTTADIVETLPTGTELTVTGPAGEADGRTWYPVENLASGQSGYVAADFVRAKT